jgi:hypothetical protein
MTVGVLERCFWAIVDVCTYLAEAVAVARTTFFDSSALTAAIRQQAVDFRADIGLIFDPHDGFAIFPVADVIHISVGELS